MLETESPQPKIADEAAFGPPALTWAAVAAPLRRPAGPSFPLNPEQVLALQRTSGNTAVNRLLRKLRPARRVGRALSRVANFTSAHSPAVRLIQRSNPADKRLPADKPEALAHANTAKVEILAALGSLSASPDVARKNIPDLVAAKGLTLGPLTPRHDSPVAGATINFFTGTVDYTGTATSADTLTHHVPAVRTNVFIRARDHANVDTMLPRSADRRPDRAGDGRGLADDGRPVGRPRQLRCLPRQVQRLLGGRAAWGWPPSGIRPSTAAAPGRRGRAEHLPAHLLRGRRLRHRLRRQHGRIQERVDRYMGPDSLNALNSPRVQALRERFRAHPRPAATTAQYNALKADVQAGAAGLQPEDREAISKSSQWGSFLIDHASTAARRDELRSIITTVPAAPPAPVVPPVAPPVAPPPPSPRERPRRSWTASRSMGRPRRSPPRAGPRR